MIVESLTHLFTPAPKWVKKLGFVAEAIAIEERLKRCQQNWLPHLNRSKKIILAEAAKLPSGSHILVIGAGGLHDVPYRCLAVSGYKMSLLDIVFLKAARAKVKRLSGIALIEHDITNYAKPFFNWLDNPNTALPEPTAPPHINELVQSKPDLIISLNILSQLPIQFEEKVRAVAHGQSFAKQEQALIEQHIYWLKSQNCPVLIITDIEWQTLLNEKTESIEPLPHLKALGEPVDTWHWDIAPKGEAHKSKALRHKVGAWLLNN